VRYRWILMRRDGRTQTGDAEASSIDPDLTANLAHMIRQSRDRECTVSIAILNIYPNARRFGRQSNHLTYRD
jgi:hypothetical protein